MTEQPTSPPSSESGFLRPLLLLAQLRRKLTTRAYARNSSALLGAFALVLILGPAALAAGTDASQTLAKMQPDAHEGFLRGFLGGFQAIWLLLLLPGSAALLGQSLPASTLRPFPIRSTTIIAAGTLGSMADVPLLLALPVLIFIGIAVCSAAAGMTWLAIVIALLTALVFTAQTALLAQLVEQAGALFSRQRRVTVALAVGLLMAGAAIIFLPGLTRPNILVQEKIVLPPPAPVWMTVLPSGVAALTLGAVSRGAWGVALLGLLGTAGYATLTFALAARFLENATLREARGGGTGSTTLRSSVAPEAARTPSHRIHATPVGQTLAVARAELRALVRDPGAHLPLRQPATLLFTCTFAWMSTDLGANYLQIAGDLISMAGILFPLFWQIQLLTNRFGNDARTAGLLFSFPVCRRRLLIGKNLAAMALLLLVNAFLFLALALAAKKWEWLGILLPNLPTALLIGCILGNPISALAPFPIQKQDQSGSPEPNRNLAAIYLFVGAGIVAGVMGVQAAFAASLLYGFGTVILLLALYVVSVVFSARILQRRERELIATLDA